MELNINGHLVHDRSVICNLGEKVNFVINYP